MVEGVVGLTRLLDGTSASEGPLPMGPAFPASLSVGKVAHHAALQAIPIIRSRALPRRGLRLLLLTLFTLVRGAAFAAAFAAIGGAIGREAPLLAKTLACAAAATLACP